MHHEITKSELSKWEVGWEQCLAVPASALASVAHWRIAAVGNAWTAHWHQLGIAKPMPTNAPTAG